MDKKITSGSGKLLEDLNMEAILRDELTTGDFMISASTLIAQAEAAESAGYRLLGHNLRRAAELTHVSNEEILEIYETLRPGRTSYERLVRLASRLEEELNAPLTAQLVRKAAEAYVNRGIIELSNVM